MISLFKDKFGLKITISTNLKVVNFLDATLNLLTGTNLSKKTNDTYSINVNSNHPPNIIKTIPEIISKRISDISSNEDIFKQAAPYYNNALSNSGYKDKISYTREQERNPKNRGRNIIWFNPSYSTNVKTNVAKKFLLLVDNPKNHRLRILFNRNNVKVSSAACQASQAS